MARIFIYAFFALLIAVSGQSLALENLETSEKTASHSGMEKISLSLDVVPVMSIEDCAVDKRCELYLYVAPGDGKNYISSRDVKRSWTAVTEVQLSDINVRGKVFKKNITMIHARTPEQCVKDEICAWYAFRQTALTADKDDPYTLKVQRQIEGPLKWYYVTLVKTSVKDELLSLMKQVSESMPFNVEEVQRANEANLVYVTTGHVDNTVVAYQESTKDILFFESSDSEMGRPTFNGAQYKTLPETDQKAPSIRFMGDSAEDRLLLPASLMTSLGFRANLSKFPLSVLNNPEEVSLPVDVASLTALDLLMLRIFYAPEFDQPMSAKEARKKFHDVYLREVTR